MFTCSCLFHIVNPPRTCRAASSVFVSALLMILCSLFVCGPRQASCMSVSELFPFGEGVSDKQTQRTDDGGSGEIKLSVMFPFFGKRHDKIYVNNNGVISFVAELPTYTPENFPLKQQTPIIAPYWADVDITNSTGTVWYREARDPTILAKATKEVRLYSGFKNFRAYWVFVATWDDVGFYGAQGEGKNKKNTFQAVLILDATGKQSFVILNYAKIEWTTGNNNRGDPETGLGGDPAQAGFNAGDGENYFEIEGARTSSVINLTQISNVGVPGKWIFRIDSTEIQDVCSQLDSGSLTFQSAFASMLGGDTVYVTGHCFDSEAQLRGRLTIGDGEPVELCCFVDNVSAKCYLPTLFHTGIANISLNVDDRGWNYSGQIEIKNVMDVKTDVIRINPDLWLTDSTVSVSWNTDFFVGASGYKFDVLAFMVSNGTPSLQSVSNVTHEKNELNMYNIHLPKDFSGATVAVVKVTAMPNNCSRNLAGPSIFSDVFPVRYADVSHSDEVCVNWFIEQSHQKPLIAAGHCPCTLSQAEGDTAQFVQDPFCSVNSDWSANCRYRSKFASQCIIPNQSIDNGTYVCCYDKDSGELLIALEGNGGGTVERFTFRQDSQGVVPYFTYIQEEIVPYMYCCDFSSNNTLCDLYLKVRQPVDCRGYQPPAAAQAAGDPHIVTLDGCSYTFNGVGKYTLLRVKDTDAVIQVKAVLATNDKNQPQNATVFSAVAMKASNSSPVLEIRLRLPGEQDLVSAYTDSKPFVISTATSQLSEMTVIRNTDSNGTVELTVVMDEIGLSVLVQATDELLNIMVMAGSRLKGQLEGLLGNYNGDKSDDLIASDGTMLAENSSMRDIHYIFGMSWYVPENDSLFTTEPNTDFDNSNSIGAEHLSLDISYVPIFLDEMQDAALPNDTEAVCEGNEECRFDYLVTGKKSVALSTRMFNERFEARKKDVSEAVRCPYVSTSAIENGSRNMTSLKVGANLTVHCDDGFDLTGPNHLTCEETGEWNSSPPTCVKIIIPDESLPVTVAAGAAAAGFVLVLAAVVTSRILYKRCSRRKFAKSVPGSDFEHDLPIVFPISDIPTPVFENSLFMTSLYKLSERGGFHIPRPTFVDPNIYSEYF